MLTKLKLNVMVKLNLARPVKPKMTIFQRFLKIPLGESQLNDIVKVV